MLNKYFSFLCIKSYVFCCFHFFTFLLFAKVYHNEKKYVVHFCRTLPCDILSQRQFGVLT